MTNQQAEALTAAYRQKIAGKELCSECGEPFFDDELNENGQCIDCENELDKQREYFYHTLISEQ